MVHSHLPLSARVDYDSYFWYVHCGAGEVATTVETSSSYFHQGLERDVRFDNCCGLFHYTVVMYVSMTGSIKKLNDQ